MSTPSSNNCIPDEAILGFVPLLTVSKIWFQPVTAFAAPEVAKLNLAIVWLLLVNWVLGKARAVTTGIALYKYWLLPVRMLLSVETTPVDTGAFLKYCKARPTFKPVVAALTPTLPVVMAAVKVNPFGSLAGTVRFKLPKIAFAARFVVAAFNGNVPRIAPVVAFFKVTD